MGVLELNHSISPALSPFVTCCVPSHLLSLLCLKVPYIRYDHQVTSNYPVKRHYFSEFPGSCRSRPEEISHLRDENEDYLTHDEDIDVTGRSAISLNFPIARGSTTHSSREQNDHFDSSWDRNVCSRRYQNPRDYRTHQIPQARVLDKDHSSKRVR